MTTTKTTQSEQTGTKHIEINEQTWNGMVLRLTMLMTHWRHNLDYTEVRNQEASTVLNNWLKVVEPSLEYAPIEIMECLTDNLNYIKALALMHKYCKKKEGRKLFSSMLYLGLFNNTTLPSDWRTLPKEHQEEMNSIGLDT